jgi:hypothetical protein
MSGFTCPHCGDTGRYVLRENFRGTQEVAVVDGERELLGEEFSFVSTPKRACCYACGKSFPNPELEGER